VPGGTVAVFEPSEAAIDFVAEGRTRFVLGSAAAHPHPLVLGNYSVHTSAEALRRARTRSAGSAARCARMARCATRGRRWRCSGWEPIDASPVDRAGGNE
jgi:hypothetical protein